MTQKELILSFSEVIGVIGVLMLLGVSTRYRFVPIRFKYNNRERNTALIIFSLVFAAALLVFQGPLAAVLQGSFSSFSLTSGTVLLPRLAAGMLALIPTVAALIIRRQPPRSAGWDAKRLNGGLRAALVLVFLIIILRGLMVPLATGQLSSQFTALGFWMLIALAEETVFRGFLQLRLASWLNDKQGLVLTALMYTIYQIPRIALNPDGLLMGTVFTLVQGLLLGWIMLKTGHAAAPALYRAVSEWVRML